MVSLPPGSFHFSLEVADRAAATFSLEPRYPFFDCRLVKFCLALPAQQKLSAGWTRAIMRRAFTRLLPDEICWRGTKSDLNPNFKRGLIAFEREQIHKTIIRGEGPVREYADIPALRRAYGRYLRRNSDRDALTVWKAVTLDLWLDRINRTPRSC